MSDNLQLLYVGGYGRSGSTLLERLIGASETIEALGELNQLPHQFAEEQAHCGCRHPVRHCPMWGEVHKRLQKKTKQNFAGFDPFKGKPPNLSQFRPFHEQLLKTLQDTLDDSVRYVTDISKTTMDAALRPYLLQQCSNVQVYMVHLLRDGRACLWSNYKRDRRKEQNIADETRSWLSRLRSHPILRTGIHWPAANLAAQSYRLWPPSKYLRIRYEELTNQPLSMLDRLERFLDADLSSSKQVVRNNELIPNAHQIDGNRLRLRDDVRLHRDKQSWKEHLTVSQKLLYNLFGGVLNHLYGY